MITNFNISVAKEISETLRPNVLNYVRRLCYTTSSAVKVYEVEVEELTNTKYSNSMLKHIFSAVPFLVEGDFKLDLTVEVETNVFSNSISTDLSIIPVQDYYLFTLKSGESAKITFKCTRKKYESNVKYTYLRTCSFKDDLSTQLNCTTQHVVSKEIVYTTAQAVRACISTQTAILEELIELIV